MNAHDLLEIARHITNTGERDYSYDMRDLYYDPKKNQFMHRPACESIHRSAITIINGKPVQTRVTRRCIYIGRYDVDVNPNWIVEDMKYV